MAEHTIRLFLDSTNPEQHVKDAATGGAPFWWRGSDVVLQLGLARNGAFVAAAEVGTLIVELKAVTADADDGSYIRKTFTADDCEAGFSAGLWNAGTSALLEVELAAHELALPQGSYRVIVRHEDAEGKAETFGACLVACVEDYSESEDLMEPPLAEAGEVVEDALTFQGFWDASTNVPELLDGDGSAAGDFRIVQLAGTADHGAGAVAYAVNDRVVFAEGVWQRVANPMRQLIEEVEVPAEPVIHVLVLAQSNLANGRAGGDTSFHPDVEMWVADTNENAEVSGYQAWDLSLQPPQHSWPNLVDGIGNSMPGADRNKWSHALAKKLQRATRSKVRIIQAAQSGTPLKHWLTTENGGEQEIWDYLTQAVLDSGAPRFDYLFFDHGESGTGNALDYEAALRSLRDQLESAGYIDDATTVLTRQIYGAATAAAATQVWITERNGNGHMVDDSNLEYYSEGDVHITGESHDIVAAEHADFIFSREGVSVDLEDATLSAKVPEGAMVVYSHAGKLCKIPAAAFLVEAGGSPFPVDPDLVFYAEDYVEGGGQIDGGDEVLTLDGGDTEPTLDAETVALAFANVDSSFRTAAPVLDQAGDWVVGMRVLFSESTAAQRTLWEQMNTSAGDSADRTYLRYSSGGKLRFRLGGDSGIDVTTGDSFGIDTWYSILMERRGDTVYVTAGGNTSSGTGTNLRVQQQPLVMGTGIMGRLRGALRKIIVYNRATTSEERAGIQAWLDGV